MFRRGCLVCITEEPSQEEEMSIASPTIAEITLPWKRTTGREVLPCSVSLCLQDDHEPLLGEAPSWVNNSDYICTSSPPVTPQVPRGTSDCHPGLDNPSLETETLYEDKDVESTDETQHLLPWRSADTEPAETCGPVISQYTPETRNGDTVEEITNDDTNPEPEVSLPLPWRSQDTSPVEAVDVRETLSSNEGQTNGLPWRDEKPMEPVAQSNGCDDDILPPPWRCHSNNSPPAETAEPTPSQGATEPVEDVIPPPWKSQSASVPVSRQISNCSSQPGCLSNPHKDSVDNGLSQAEDTLPPPPWQRTESCCQFGQYPLLSRNSSSSNSGGGGSHRHGKDIPHLPPPPWRHVESNPVLRSPGASHDADLYSLRPQMSSLSFRFSEAESKHSEHMHVHHMIDPPHERPHVVHCDNGDERRSLDLGYEDDDDDADNLHQRVVSWLLGCDPEPIADDDNLQEPAVDDEESCQSLGFRPNTVGRTDTTEQESVV